MSAAVKVKPQSVNGHHSHAAAFSANGTRSEMVSVTPEIADSLLAYNTHNRLLRHGRVLEKAEQMSKGLWRPSNDSIVIIEMPDGTRSLINGQHRLWAVKISNTVQDFLILYYDGSRYTVAEIYRIIDQGTRRSFSDALRDMPIPEGTTKDSIRRAAMAVRVWQTGVDKLTEDRICGVAPTTLENELIDHPEQTTLAARWYRAGRLRGRDLSLTYGAMALGLQMAELYPMEANDFMNRVIRGGDEHHPATVLARRIRNDFEANGRSTVTTVSTVRKQYNLAVHAWNAYCNGRRSMKLQDAAVITRPEAPGDKCWLTKTKFMPLED